jgi:hypothetical protein
MSKMSISIVVITRKSDDIALSPKRFFTSDLDKYEVKKFLVETALGALAYTGECEIARGTLDQCGLKSVPESRSEDS